jgi:hypothetical protein
MFRRPNREELSARFLPKKYRTEWNCRQLCPDGQPRNNPPNRSLRRSNCAAPAGDVRDHDDHKFQLSHETMPGTGRFLHCLARPEGSPSAELSRVPVTVLGSGRAVVGQALSVDLTREEVLQILTVGFLPITAPDEMPAHGRSTALRELGLPYASDPAITKYLAAFLTQAAVTMNGLSANHGSFANHRMARPNAVLFNGGFCAPAVTRDRIVDAISVWFGGARTGWRPKLLNNEAVDSAVESAVARGAAYYGRVRRGTGLRIRAGSARTYYIGWRSYDGLQGICVLPAGVEEGATLPLLDREFSVLANRPVSPPCSRRSRRLVYDRDVWFRPSCSGVSARGGLIRSR